MTVKHKLVTFKGNKYWLIPDTHGGGALAPLEHADADGNILEEHAFSTSFAHLYEDGNINRFGVKIGTKEDLQ